MSSLSVLSPIFKKSERVFLNAHQYADGGLRACLTPHKGHEETEVVSLLEVDMLSMQLSLLAEEEKGE